MTLYLPFLSCFENNSDDRDHEREFEDAYTKALDAGGRPIQFFGASTPAQSRERSEKMLAYWTKYILTERNKK